jgi:cardiolipin synthase
VNLANAISIARLLSVPLIVWLMLKHEWTLAFCVFVAAGVSDAIDGLLARRFGMMTELGSYLDPLADKALLVAIYIVMGWMGQVSEWLVILVVSRDILIIGGTMLSAVIGYRVRIRPLLVGKLNTGAQIALAACILAHLAFGWFPDLWITALVWLVAATTIVSGAGYLVQWSRRQAGKEGS